MSAPSRRHPRTRATFLRQLLDRVLDDSDDARRLALRTRELGDPTIALLDAWATTADVIAFYTERIRAEGYLDTAVEPSSVLALASLLGTRPRPGLAASVHLAYTLHADPGDTAVLLSAGLLAQSVPGPGEQPQTFETTAELVARPSWNVLVPRAARPLALTDLTRASVLLAVDGISSRLKARDVLLLEQKGTVARVLHIRTVRPDSSGVRTIVVADQATTAVTPESATPGSATPGSATPSAAAPAAATGSVAPAPTDIAGLVDTLVTTLGKRPDRFATTPGPAQSESFTTSSDLLPRLVATLRPEIAGTLYSALASSPTAPESVPKVSTMRAVAAPFGTRAAQRVVIDERGQQVGTEDWALGGEHVVTGTLGASGLLSLLQEQSPEHTSIALRSRIARLAGLQADQRDKGLALVTAGSPGRLVMNNGAEVGVLSNVRFNQDAGLEITRNGDTDGLVLAYHDEALPIVDFKIDVQIDSDSGLITFTSDDGSTTSWDPGVDTDMHGQLGATRHLDIQWNPDASAVTARIRTALPLSDPTVLHLDARYDEIVPGTTVLITGNAVPMSDGAPGLLTTITDASTVSTSQYGMTAMVTRLELAHPWVGDQRSLADVRDVTVHAQSDPLALLPVPIDDPLADQRIELDGLHAGIEPGRELIVTGTRIDLPGTATVPAGELVVVSSVDVVVDRAAGGTPYTALNLLRPLAYTYRRDSVQIFGNVVTAHQGATRTEVLGGGRPEQTRQSFVLSAGPTFADPSDTGVQSSLGVHVDGQLYDEVDRIDESTASASYVTGLDPDGKTTVTFAAALPRGEANVIAVYRSGAGGAGNARPVQITQLLSRPLAVTAVQNPLAASGGSDPDGPDTLRARVPVGLASLGKAVSLTDYADLARSWPGVGQASSALVSDGRAMVVHVCVSASEPAAVTGDSALLAGLQGNLAAADPTQHVVVDPVQLMLIVARASIVYDPKRTWDSVSGAVRGALVDALGYSRRMPGEPVYVSAMIKAAHRVPGVLSCTITGLALVSSQPTAAELAALPTALSAPVPPVVRLPAGDTSAPLGTALPAAQLAFLSDALPDLLILDGQTP